MLCLSQFRTISHPCLTVSLEHPIRLTNLYPSIIIALVSAHDKWAWFSADNLELIYHPTIYGPLFVGYRPRKKNE